MGDSSVHDTVLLNRITPTNEAIFIIIRVHVRLSHPVEMDVVLRKRISVSVYRQKGIMNFRRKLTSKTFSKSKKKKISKDVKANCSGVVYDIISNIPLASCDGEDHETLAVLAASGAQDPDDSSEESSLNKDDSDEDLTNHFEKYVIRATKSVENILLLDRIRQEIALRNSLINNSSDASSINRATFIQNVTKRAKLRAPSIVSGISTIRRSIDPLQQSPLHQQSTSGFGQGNSNFNSLRRQPR